MEALTNALAALVALEARFTELVNPVEAIAEAVKTVVKEAAIVIEDVHGRVTGLEQLEGRVAALEAHATAVSLAPAVQSDIPAFPPAKPEAAPEPTPAASIVPSPAIRLVDAEAGTAVDYQAPDASVSVAAAPAAEGSGT